MIYRQTASTNKKISDLVNKRTRNILINNGNRNFNNIIDRILSMESALRNRNSRVTNPGSVYLKGSPTLRGSGIGVDSAMTDDILTSYNVINRNHTDWFNKFSRTPFIDPYTNNTNTREYIFITKPDLHLFDPSGNPNPELINKSSFFQDALVRYKEVALQLQYSINGSSAGPFSPLLSNAFNGHLELPSISSTTIDTPSNVYGTHLTYRGTSYESDEQFDFSMDFKDSKYLEVYMFFKMYDMYERMKWKGEVSPTSILYVYRKILHDQMSIYKFIVGEDGTSLIYWARLIGCMPLSVPRDTFSTLEDGEINYSVNWKAQFVQDMDPIILTDFNRITYNARQRGREIPLYDQSTHLSDTEWAISPAIYTRNDTSTKANRYNQYYLRWIGE